jgi:hypothetical protein
LGQFREQNVDLSKVELRARRYAHHTRNETGTPGETQVLFFNHALPGFSGDANFSH